MQEYGGANDLPSLEVMSVTVTRLVAKFLGFKQKSMPQNAGPAGC